MGNDVDRASGQSKGLSRHLKEYRLGPHIAAAVGDIASYLGVPGANLVGKAMEALHDQRMERAREVLLEDIRSGLVHIGDDARVVDELAPIMHRYFRAAADGAARNNLRLLARIIAGHLCEDALSASEFLAWSDVLAGLRPPEIRVLAGIQQFVDASGEAWSWEDSNVAARLLIDKTSACAACTVDEVNSALAGLTRTGFLLPSIMASGMAYRLSSQFAAFRRIASFDGLEPEALKRSVPRREE